jgi:hypothetical protein
MIFASHLYDDLVKGRGFNSHSVHFLRLGRCWTYVSIRTAIAAYTLFFFRSPLALPGTSCGSWWDSDPGTANMVISDVALLVVGAIIIQPWIQHYGKVVGTNHDGLWLLVCCK